MDDIIMRNICFIITVLSIYFLVVILFSGVFKFLNKKDNAVKYDNDLIMFVTVLWPFFIACFIFYWAYEKLSTLISNIIYKIYNLYKTKS